MRTGVARAGRAGATTGRAGGTGPGQAGTTTGLVSRPRPPALGIDTRGAVEESPGLVGLPVLEDLPAPADLPVPAGRPAEAGFPAVAGLPGWLETTYPLQKVRAALTEPPWAAMRVLNAVDASGPEIPVVVEVVELLAINAVQRPKVAWPLVIPPTGPEPVGVVAGLPAVVVAVRPLAELEGM